MVPIPDGGRPYSESIVLHYLGHLDVVCPNCHVIHFISERLSKSSIQNPQFGMCYELGWFGFASPKEDVSRKEFFLSNKGGSGFRFRGLAPLRQTIIRLSTRSAQR